MEAGGKWAILRLERAQVCCRSSWGQGRSKGVRPTTPRSRQLRALIVGHYFRVVSDPAREPTIIDHLTGASHDRAQLELGYFSRGN
jgi:hypothetical protein